MNPDDICSGCSRHLGFCMCSIALGPEGIEVKRPKPVNLAGKLRIIAGEGKQAAIQAKTQSVPEQIIIRATIAAKGGRTELRIWLSEFNLTKEEAEAVGKVLERDGFNYTVTDEITAMYSNTDWDSEHLLTVTW